MSMNFSDIAILNIRGAEYCYVISGFSKSEAINLTLMKMGFLLDNKGMKEGKMYPPWLILDKIKHRIPSFLSQNTLMISSL